MTAIRKSMKSPCRLFETDCIHYVLHSKDPARLTRVNDFSLVIYAVMLRTLYVVCVHLVVGIYVMCTHMTNKGKHTRAYIKCIANAQVKLNFVQLGPVEQDLLGNEDVCAYTHVGMHLLCYAWPHPSHMNFSGSVTLGSTMCLHASHIVRLHGKNAVTYVHDVF